MKGFFAKYAGRAISSDVNMFESKSGENSSFMLENVTSNILHCPCPQVKTCEPTSKYMYHHKILAGREKHEP